MFSFFNTYNIRARLSVGIILFSPVIISLYLQVQTVKDLSTTIVVALTLFAASNILIMFVRQKGKNIGENENGRPSRRDVLRNYFFNKLNAISRERICDILKEKDNRFAALAASPADELLFDSALGIMQEETRDKPIVAEENVMYGFVRNMLGVKRIGIGLCILCCIIEVMALYVTNYSLLNIEMLIALVVDIVYLGMWVFLVNDKLLSFTAENYAEALFKAISDAN